MRYFTLVFFGLFLCTQSVLASAANQFSVRSLVGTDSAPPTTPTLLAVNPIASSQIDVTWSPATDDFQLLGYTISRNGIHVATTTLTSYSDTGLTASTTYAYSVQAFDWLFNRSSSSNELSTTTLGVPVPPVSSPPATSTVSATVSSGRLMLQSAVTVVPQLNEATVTWTTSRPSRYEIRWGRTTSYELGYITADRYREQHETVISDLLPGTTYFYEIVGFNTFSDIPQTLSVGQFTTKFPIETDIPPNVTDLRVTVQGVVAVLSWQNPTLKTDEYTVRIVRNHLGYPLDPYDGMVIYQGRGTDHLDSSALVRHAQQFYTVFVIDAAGRWSSGALARVSVPNDVGLVTPEPFLPPTQPGGMPTTPSDISLPALSLYDIGIRQGGVRFDFFSTAILLSAHEPFSISIPRGALPSRLKSIMVTLLDPRDYTRAYRFLLRLNDTGTAYEATLDSVGVAGATQLLIEVYDLEAMVIGRYGKQVQFVTGLPGARPVLFPDAIFMSVWFPWILAATGLGCAGVFWVAWRKRRREDNEGV